MTCQAFPPQDFSSSLEFLKGSAVPRRNPTIHPSPRAVASGTTRTMGSGALVRNANWNKDSIVEVKASVTTIKPLSQFGELCVTCQGQNSTSLSSSSVVSSQVHFSSFEMLICLMYSDLSICIWFRWTLTLRKMPKTPLKENPAEKIHEYLPGFEI